MKQEGFGESTLDTEWGATICLQPFAVSLRLCWGWFARRHMLWGVPVSHQIDRVVHGRRGQGGQGVGRTLVAMLRGDFEK